ncbi:MAG: 3-isopropylmalate dehydrogenase [Gammaproteobacteria bacterium]|jgi:3-isopropylmalate dehydrogenase|nr:3-isopropylmalate dehydrogenase [Gammaproteobacteria bacterium]MDP6095707.1 3-isopropylmalate dehydrogenase [Gammaproteobacteria bacterium]MDP7455082.1 3-isopropylmalate dehydrogenase [Gammaproteobacteria bacterium]HJO10919.1 3-isopropylmalate dehydrogenase [Gammaproteobacteria bacterium]|tara:strand:+ start:526 stop:1629 length:1104 start_codon:yes stop_codon:yes gene_type:complete
MTSYKIALLDGDGIGPEIMTEAVKVLELVGERNEINFELIHGSFGANAYFEQGHAFPEQTKALCDEADAILKGPIGLSHEESKKIPLDMQPERGALLPLRRRYNTFANFRPVFLPKGLAHFSPLKPSIIGAGIDFIIIRELVGGLYFGAKHTGVNEQGKRFVNESLEYDEEQIARIARVAFETSMKRKKVLHNIHKSNVLQSSVLWNEVLGEISQEFPEVEVRHILVDAAATYLCLNPGQFDVMVMENMFGDILSDQAGGILGSLGLMPSACIGPEKAYYEPSHGSAPDIAGQSIANPYSMIGSVAMMLEMSFSMEKEAKNCWHAMQSVFSQGYSTPDLSQPGAEVKMIDTQSFGDLVVSELAQLAC